MNKRQRMNDSNRKAREWLFENGYDELYFKPHKDIRKRHNVEYVYCKDYNYQIMDFYNLFDGFGFDAEGVFTFLQVKTNKWPDFEKIKNFLFSKRGIKALIINVKTPSKEFPKTRILVKELHT